MRRITLAALTLVACSAIASAHPVLMISIDGLRPADVIDAKARGLNLPHLTAFLAEGAYATGVRNTLPTVTYPDHTTLITGVWPSTHGVTNNTVFDPLSKNMGGWYWYAADIKVPTLWDAVHAAHGVTASLSWPVSVGDTSIDWNIPEYWRTFYAPEDEKLNAALSTPGLAAALAAATGLSADTLYATDGDNDITWARYAAALIALKHPQFMTLHVSSLDHYQHVAGPGSEKAHAILEKLDSSIGALIDDARKTEPDLVIAIVSDHGFANVDHDVNLMPAFVDAGLVTLDPKTSKPTAWQAEPWEAGGSIAIMLADPSDKAMKDKVAALLKKLADDPANGIAQVIDRDGIAKRNGGPEPSFWVDLKIGYSAGHNNTGPIVTAPSVKGMHGYFPSHPEMRATFMIAGPGVPKKGSLGEIDMIDIAPTLAKILDVKLPTATGKPLF
jgi:predicted AlkP superfamily pyrophosphatase or phosphodiesterase